MCFLISMSCGQKSRIRRLKEANIIQKRVKCMASDIINAQKLFDLPSGKSPIYLWTLNV